MMFTGIVQGTGCVGSVSGDSIVTLGIQIPSTQGLDVGASVSIDGVCLTATSVGETVTFDIIPKAPTCHPSAILTPDKIHNELGQSLYKHP